VNILVASDHAVYIGVLTNLVLALLIRLGLDQETRRGWIGQVIFWGVNLGLLVFVVGLILDVTELKRIGAPLMGATLLLALGLLAWAVSRGTVDTAADELSAPAT
jgi:hypothetical protein